MTKNEYNLKLHDLIDMGLNASKNKELTPPLNNTVGIGIIKPFIGLIIHLAINWESDKDGNLINDLINNYKKLI